MRKLSLLLLWLIGGIAMNAGEVTEQEAFLKAQRFMEGKRIMQGKKLVQNNTQVRRSSQKEAVAYYVFNVESDGGFVIVSGDDRTAEILGYSDHGSLNPDNAPDNVKWWLSEYERQISCLLASANAGTTTPIAQTGHRAAWAPIEPLVKSQWDQGAPYNDLCPTETTGEKTYTGCVATATAQIMNYYQWPEKGRGSNSYYWKGSYLSMNFSEITFDWANMQNTYGGQDDSPEAKNAVATLMYACGIGVNMEYGASASGAPSPLVKDALFNYFSYDAKYLERLNTESSEWETIVYTELANNRPVYYAGYSSKEGHAFVCDGYSTDGLFHINWGWSGWCDGYFLLSVLVPYPGSAGFNSSQEIVYGIRPSKMVIENGVYYMLIEEGKKAIVCLPEEGNYTGDLTILETVVHENESYQVRIPEDLWSHCQNLTSLIVYPAIDEFGPYWNFYSSPNIKTVKLYNVSHINASAFSGCTNLTTLELGPELETIGNDAFYGCQALTELTIPDKVKSIGERAFLNCRALTTLKLGSELETIGYNAFYGCNALTELTIPDKVKSIGSSTFYNCNALTTLKLGSELEAIGNDAFAYCYALTELTVPDKVKSIGSAAFAQCNALTTLKLSSELETIGYNAFSGCQALTELIIPDKVKSIGESAFARCMKLTSVISQIEEPFAINENVFSSLRSSNATLYVPQGTKAKYQATDGWKVFENVKESGELVEISIANEDGLATYCPVVGIDFTNGTGATEIAAYKASVNGNAVTLTRVDKVAAGEGVLLRSVKGGKVESVGMPIDIYATNNEDNAFAGTLKDVVLGETTEKDGIMVTNYVLSKKNDVVGFYKANNTKVAAGKAYLPIEVGSVGAAALRITFDDSETTGIDAMPKNGEERTNKAFYNLNGQRVAKPAKGLYIVDGNKVVIK